MVFKGSKDDSKGIKMKQYKYQINGKKYEVSVETPAADGTIAVTVNGETCTMRGKKLRRGDRAGIDGNIFEVC